MDTDARKSQHRDVFLCYHKDDSPSVETIASLLRKHGVQPWLDEWHIVPGTQWMPAIEQALDTCATCAIFVGPSGISPWQHEQVRVAIGNRVKAPANQYRVIPVVLPGAQRGERSVMPAFLRDTRWVEFRATLNDERVLHHLMCGIRGVEPEIGVIVGEGEPPYRGLQPFDTAHARFFFGREALVDWLLDDLTSTIERQSGARFLTIIGASGSGKSSLAHAGLLTALQKGRIAGSEHWRYTTLTPGSQPLVNLVKALVPILKSNGTLNIETVINEIVEDESGLDMFIRRELRDAPADQRLVVFIDQFEELFTQCADLEQRRQFIAGLAYAASVVRGRTLVVITLRSDFYTHSATYSDLAALLSRHQMLVGPLTPLELRRAIEQPAFVARYEFEGDLVDMLVADAGERAELPLMQYALFQLWEQRDQQQRRLTKTAYKAIGGVQGALEQHAERVYETFTPDEQQVCRQIMLDLIQPGEADDDTRRRIARDHVAPAIADRQLIIRIVERLASPEACLLTIDSDSKDGAGQVQIAHESLIQAWARLRRWVEQVRVELRLQRELSRVAQHWERNGRNNDDLLRERQLAEMEPLTKREDLGERDTTFLMKSVAAVRKRRRQRVFMRGGLAMLILLLLVSAYFVKQTLDEARSPWGRSAQLSFTNPANDIKALPGSPPIFYVATKDLGVGYSNDGQSWKFTPAQQIGLPLGKLEDGDPTKIVGSTGPLAVDPLAPQRLLVGFKLHDIYASDDSAATWHPAHQGIDTSIRKAFNLTTLDMRGNLALAIFQNLPLGGGTVPPGKLYISRDGGSNWRDETPATAEVIYTAVIAPDSTIIYVGTQQGLFRSVLPVNSEEHLRWEQMPDLPPTLKIAFSTDSQTLYLASAQVSSGSLDLLCWKPGAASRLLNTTRDQVRVLTPRPEALYVLQINGKVLKINLSADGCGNGTKEDLGQYPGLAYTLEVAPGGTQLLLGHEDGVLEYRKSLGKPSP